MTPADWAQVKRVFDEAVARPVAERRAWLQGACQGCPGLEHEVRSLLDAHERAGAFLDTAGADQAARGLEEHWLGRRLGPYVLEGVLGCGGMGIVYRATRAAPAREVAIKLLAGPGLELVQRFGAESQILARLDHPNVARLFDVGQAPDGRPYFVMELVDGVPVDRHCAAARLDLRARLQLFLKVCEAVSYAHGRLVVHRDIKPGNVLVDAAGQPKLLDFGIARLLDEQPGGQTTETGLRLMTPEFASPEQVRGEPASVATDVHALGLLLYLLLTGRSPFWLRSPSPAELVRVVCLEDAPPPSVLTGRRPAAESRTGFEPPEPAPRLARLLRGDLDAIVARALRKEPQHRYASVAQLADDVRAQLEGRPVQAREGRWRYRLGKFARRNRLPVALGAGLLLALVGGLVATFWQARVAQSERARAEKRLADVRRLATSFLFEFHDAIVQLPGSTRARELVVSKALEHLDGLAQEASDDPQLRLELAQAYQRVGVVQGVPGQPNLGDLDGAKRSMQKAYALLEPNQPGAGFDLQRSMARLDVMVDLARAHGQVGEFDRALELLRLAAAEAPRAPPEGSNPENVRAWVLVFRDLAFELQRRGELEEAERAAATALKVAQQVMARWPDDANARRMPVFAYRALSAIQAERGRLDEARANARAGVAVARADTRSDETRSQRALVHALLAEAAVEDDLAAADRIFAEALQLTERLAAHDPNDRQASSEIPVVLGQWCEKLNRAGVRLRPRDVCAESARGLARDLDPSDEWAVSNVAGGRYNLGWQKELQGDRGAALRLYAAALAGLEAPVLAGSGSEVSIMRAQMHAAVARVRLDLGHAAAARAAAQASLASLGPTPSARSDKPETLELRVRLYALLARTGGAHGLDCDALEVGVAPADALRPLLAQLPRLAPSVAGFDELRRACPGRAR